MKNTFLIFWLLLISGRVYTAENTSAGIGAIGAVVGKSELVTAITEHDHEKVVAALAAGASAKTIIGNGFTRTMLHIAIDSYHPEIPASKEIINALLDHGAPVDDRTPSQETPLYTAVKKELYEVVEILLQNRARDSYILCLQWAIKPENRKMLNILLNKNHLRTRIGILRTSCDTELVPKLEGLNYTLFSD